MLAIPSYLKIFNSFIFDGLDLARFAFPQFCGVEVKFVSLFSGVRVKNFVKASFKKIENISSMHLKISAFILNHP